MAQRVRIYKKASTCMSYELLEEGLIERIGGNRNRTYKIKR